MEDSIASLTFFDEYKIDCDVRLSSLGKCVIMLVVVQHDGFRTKTIPFLEKPFFILQSI